MDSPCYIPLFSEEFEVTCLFLQTERSTADVEYQATISAIMSAKHVIEDGSKGTGTVASSSSAQPQSNFVRATMNEPDEGVNEPEEGQGANSEAISEYVSRDRCSHRFIFAVYWCESPTRGVQADTREFDQALIIKVSAART